MERSEENRQEFQETIAKKSFKDLVYLDESGIDDDEVYPYGWGQKGQRIYGLKKARRAKRLSIIGALNETKIKAPFVFEESCTRDVFESYVREVLVPSLNPGQTVILDNASFHKGGKISQIIEDAGCKLLYLPPYSPALNPIEHFWHSIKNSIRKNLLLCEGNIHHAADRTF